MRITALLVGLLGQGYAQASLWAPKDEKAVPAAKVETVLSWTHSPTNGVSGVVKLIAANDASSASLDHLVTTSFGSDNWDWQRPKSRQDSNPKPEVMLPEPVNVALGIFGLAFITPRAWQWKNKLRRSPANGIRRDVKQ